MGWDNDGVTHPALKNSCKSEEQVLIQQLYFKYLKVDNMGFSSRNWLFVGHALFIFCMTAE